jgi:hypothetical protein
MSGQEGQPIEVRDLFVGLGKMHIESYYRRILRDKVAWCTGHCETSAFWLEHHRTFGARVEPKATEAASAYVHLQP